MNKVSRIFGNYFLVDFLFSSSPNVYLISLFEKLDKNIEIGNNE
jgi:hypothetical protein